MAAGCQSQKWELSEESGFKLVTQRGGKTLGYNEVKLIEKKGYLFKDLNANGELDVYEDWRESPEKRAEDLANQLSIEEIAGLMLYSGHQSIPDENISDAQRKFLKEDNLRAVLMTSVKSPETAARWNNNVQAFVETLGHGIPANNSSDPRHSSNATAEYNAGAGGTISMWPSSLGMAATFDPELVEQFGQIASKEYRALGIATALSPQIDLATEPRWSRFNGTFGEDPALDTDMARAYVDGFQTTEDSEDGWGAESVNAMVKHWPSGGPEEGGRDAHYNYGKYAVYPGGAFETHLRAFTQGAFKLKGKTGYATAVMPYYTISTDMDPSGKNVGNSYSEYIIGDLLRKQNNYQGVVCTDWNITKDNKALDSFDGKCWGVETLTEAQRHYEVIKAGVDQFGGNNEKGPVLEAYQMWCDDFGEESARERFEQSAVRLLLNSFRTGLFENPYLSPSRTVETVGNPEFMAAGYEAQKKSLVMLKNHNNVLPLKKAKVYVPKRYYASSGSFYGLRVTESETWRYPVEKALVDKYFEWVDSPEEADFALVMIQDPSGGNGYSRDDVAAGGNGYVPISLQYRDYTAEFAREVSIAGGDVKEDFTNRSYKGKTVKTRNEADLDLVLDTRKVMGEKPVVVVVATSRPLVVNEFEAAADAIILSFGVQNQAIMELLAGKFEPSGLLPMQLPANMRTVEEQAEDLPRDMVCHKDSDGNSYDFAFGLNWSGVIKDHRVEKYR